MTEEEEFEFRLRYEGEQEPDASGWQEYEPLAADRMANIAGTRTGSVAKGATSLLTGPFQLGANIGDKLAEWTGEEDPWVGDYVNQKLNQWEEKKSRGRKARGTEGFDWWEMGGLVGSPMNLLKTGVVKAPQMTAGGEKVAKALSTKMFEGGKAGALYGTGMPVVDGGEDFFKAKGTQAGAGAGMGAAIPLAVSGGKLAGHVIDDATRPLAFRNTPGNWYSKTGAMPGIVKDTRDYMVEAAGEGKNKIIEALRRAKPGQTSRQALAAQSRQGDVVGSPFIKLEDDISKRVATSDVAKSVYARQEAERAAAIGGIAQTPEKLAQAQAARSANAARNYRGSRNDLIDPRSNVQMLQDAGAKAQQKALEAEMSKAYALKDWGRFKTLEAQLNQLSLGKPPIQNIPGKSSLRTQSSRDTSLQTESAPGVPMKPSMVPVRPVAQPEVPNMYNSPRYKGEVPGPSRYAPQRPVQQEAGKAATEAKAVAATRLADEQALNSINQTMLLNTVGESNKSLYKFLSRPSVIKGIQDARNSALETGSYFPTKEGQKFSVANLQRIKRSIAEDVKARKADGSLGATEQKEITSTLDDFSKWLKDKSPSFRKAEESFAKESAPINQMKVGQELEKALVNAKDAESAGPFLTAIHKAPLTIKRATGASKADKLDDYLTPEQMKSVNKVTDELLTNEAATKIASKTRSAYPALTEEAKLQIAPMLERNVMIANALMRRVARNVTPDYEKVAWDIMKTPQKMADLLKTNPEKAQSVMEYIKRMSILGPVGATEQGAN